MKSKGKQEEPKKERRQKTGGLPLLKRPSGMPKILFRELAKELARDIREEYKRKNG